MGILDKFLDVMKMDDEDDSEEEFFEEDPYEDKPKKGFFGLKKNRDDEEAVSETGRVTATKIAKPKSRMSSVSQGGRGIQGMEVKVIRPSTIEEGREIAESLCSGSTVLLNLEGEDLEIAQRIIDFTSGALFAIDGNLQKVGNYIFLLTPSGVEVSGDMSDMIGAQFGVSSLRSNF